jgi:hypothetical protein
MESFLLIRRSVVFPLDTNIDNECISTIKGMMCLRTDEFVKELIRIKNKISQEVTSNTIAEVKALKYYFSMSCQVFNKYKL